MKPLAVVTEFPRTMLMISWRGQGIPALGRATEGRDVGPVIGFRYRVARERMVSLAMTGPIDSAGTKPAAGAGICLASFPLTIAQRFNAGVWPSTQDQSPAGPTEATDWPLLAEQVSAVPGGTSFLFVIETQR
jgi:hypothetical protein